MEAIKCGSLVETKVGPFQGIITGIIIRFDSVLYEVSRPDGCKLQIDTLMEQEFTVLGKIEKMKIGFKL